MNSNFQRIFTAGAYALLSALSVSVNAQSSLQESTGTNKTGQLVDRPVATQITTPADSQDRAGTMQVPESGNSGRKPTGPVTLFSPHQLTYMSVLDADGDRIGKVSAVVRSRTDGLIHVIVTSGGILGIGAEQIPVPLRDLQVTGHNLRIDVTKRVFRGWPKYRKEQYVELKPANQPINEFSAFEVIFPR